VPHCAIGNKPATSWAAKANARRRWTRATIGMTRHCFKAPERAATSIGAAEHPRVPAKDGKVCGPPSRLRPRGSGRKAITAEDREDRSAVTTMQHLDHAIQIALEAHSGQTDKVGRPYFEHCQRVALLFSGDEARTIAYLHDVVEKGREWTLERLQDEGFPSSIISAVDALTRRSRESEDEFVSRAASNPLALPVKQADLEDNLWQADQAGGDAEKDRRGLELLRDPKNER
jgi:hypothetical protein